MTASDSYLYYSEFSNKLVGRMDLATGADETVLTETDINQANAIRYDQVSGVLYIADAGTVDNEFRDGTLRVVFGLP